MDFLRPLFRSSFSSSLAALSVHLPCPPPTMKPQQQQQQQQRAAALSLHLDGLDASSSTPACPPLRPLRSVTRTPSPGIPVLEIVTDVKQVVTHVNHNFEAFTGFKKTEVIGKKCNFLQGEGTDSEDLLDIRLAVESQRETTVVVLNYTKEKVPFWNVLRIVPVFEQRGASRAVKLFLGQIFTIPVPDYYMSQGHPRLCLDDALALIRVLSSVPRFLMNDVEEKSTTAGEQTLRVTKNGDSDSDSSSDSSMPLSEAVPIKNNVRLQRHVNYGQRFGSSSSRSSSSAPSSPSRPSTAPPALAPLSPTRTNFEFVAETLLPTNHGRFRVRAYRDAESGAEPLALIVGNVEGSGRVLCRVHDQCQTSEVFQSLRCDCKEQLEHAMVEIQKHGGIILYLPQEGRGIGIANKIAAYAGLFSVDGLLFFFQQQKRSAR